MSLLLIHVQMSLHQKSKNNKHITFYYAVYMYHVFVYFVLFFAFVFQDLNVGAETKTEL